jgi:hypothetical protein
VAFQTHCKNNYRALIARNESSGERCNYRALIARNESRGERCNSHERELPSIRDGNAL